MCYTRWTAPPKIMGAVWIALGLVYFAVHTLILKRPAAIDL
jgi:hypothetical protein